MAITNVWVEQECTLCGLCESICPEVFEVPDKMVVKAGVDFSKYEDTIKEAIDSCPTSVIKAE